MQKAINAQGTWALWILTGFFLLANAYNLFGPPPEDNIMVLFVSFDVLQVIVLGKDTLLDFMRNIAASVKTTSIFFRVYYNHFSIHLVINHLNTPE